MSLSADALKQRQDVRAAMVNLATSPVRTPGVTAENRTTAAAIVLQDLQFEELQAE